MMIHSIVKCTVISLLLLSGTSITLGQERGVQMDFREVMSIGEDLDEPLEYQFMNPVSIVTDSSNNIYVADNQMKAIKVFDPQGEYLRTIGSEGRGPGEFRSISLLAVDASQQLIVIDGSNSKVVKMDLHGGLVSEQAIQRNGPFTPVQLLDMEEEGYLMLHMMREEADASGSESDHLFHRFDRDFQSLQESFGSYRLTGFTEPYPRRTFELYEGSMWKMNSQEFLYAPRLYNGSIYRYEKGDSGWNVSQEITNSAFDSPSYGLLSMDEKVNFLTSMYPYNGQYIRGYINLMDGGIYQLNDGKIIQFVSKLKEEAESSRYRGWELHGLLYDETGTFLTSQKLLDTVYPTPDNVTVKWKDQNDRFYLLFVTGSHSYLRSYDLSLDQ